MQFNIEILYEDNNIIAANKPEGLASISENDLKLETVHSILEKQIKQKLLIVHRLDKEVSGVILFAKNAKAHKLLNHQFSSREISKTYTALVHGNILHDAGTINKSIREFGSGRMGIDERNGKKSETKYKVLDRFNAYTLVELNPSTGRRHQLRVHLYSIGFPIAGDMRYGDKANQKKFSRIMLHAKKIEFHNFDKKILSVNSPIPKSFDDEIEKLKRTEA